MAIPEPMVNQKVHPEAVLNKPIVKRLKERAHKNFGGRSGSYQKMLEATIIIAKQGARLFPEIVFHQALKVRKAFHHSSLEAFLQINDSQKHTIPHQQVKTIVTSIP
ncbi:MAG: hypothetical protein SFY68_05155 [Candidatus Sumerlaeia bacterium]|nr:hypothetical protein [Candidatus Sumerlaeia bacterium]